MAMAGEDVTTRHCRRDKRRRDEAIGTTRFSATFGGWVMSDVPTRTMSRASHYWAFVHRDEFEHTDHTGEPFVWEVCVYCGGDLPLREGEQRERPTMQGDGDES